MNAMNKKEPVETALHDRSASNGSIEPKDKDGLSSTELSTLRKMFYYSHTVFLTFNMAKMEANCFTLTMAPAIKEIYKDDLEGQREAFARHQSYFNTNAVALNFIAGLCYALERDHEQGKVPGETIDALKASLMGPTAGMFDSLFFNCLRVIAGGVGIGLCSQGNPLGAVLFTLIFGVPQSFIKWLLLKFGYTLGASFIDKIYASGLMQVATKAASILGLTMVGCMVATTVKVPIDWTITAGEASVNVLELLDGIYPGILGAALTLVMMGLVKKGARPLQLIVGLLVFGVAGALLSIF